VRILADAKKDNGEWKVRVVPILRNGKESDTPMDVKAEKITNLMSAIGEGVKPRSRIPPKRFGEEQPADTKNTYMKKIKRNLQTDPNERFYDAYHYQDDEVLNKESSSDSSFVSFPSSSDDSTECSVDSESCSHVNLSDNFETCVDQPGVCAANSSDSGDNSIASERTWDTQ
jgi:hypothetical protein